MYKATTQSSWIKGTDYIPTGKGKGVLVIYPQDTTTVKAMLYFGVPSWVRGLVHAGAVKSGEGVTLQEAMVCNYDRSIGRAYNKLVKSRYFYRRVEKSEFERIACGQYQIDAKAA